MIDEENDLIVSHDLLCSDVTDTEQKLVQLDQELNHVQELITKTELKHKVTLEALENLAGAKIVSLPEFKEMTRELQRVNTLLLEHIQVRGNILRRKHELTVELRTSKAELQSLEHRLQQLEETERRKVLEFKK